MSLKADQFKEFSLKVVKHIEEYVVPQYGDHPDKILRDIDVGELKFSLSKYVARIDSNSRPDESARDALKIAHYACYLHSILTTRRIDHGQLG